MRFQILNAFCAEYVRPRLAADFPVRHGVFLHIALIFFRKNTFRKGGREYADEQGEQQAQPNVKTQVTIVHVNHLRDYDSTLQGIGLGRV